MNCIVKEAAMSDLPSKTMDIKNDSQIPYEAFLPELEEQRKAFVEVFLLKSWP
jgi:hypothetical protein